MKLLFVTSFFVLFIDQTSLAIPNFDVTLPQLPVTRTDNSEDDATTEEGTTTEEVTTTTTEEPVSREGLWTDCSELYSCALCNSKRPGADSWLEDPTAAGAAFELDFLSSTTTGEPTTTEAETGEPTTTEAESDPALRCVWCSGNAELHSAGSLSELKPIVGRCVALSHRVLCGVQQYGTLEGLFNVYVGFVYVGFSRRTVYSGGADLCNDSTVPEEVYLYNTCAHCVDAQLAWCEFAFTSYDSSSYGGVCMPTAAACDDVIADNAVLSYIVAQTEDQCDFMHEHTSMSFGLCVSWYTVVVGLMFLSS